MHDAEAFAASIDRAAARIAEQAGARLLTDGWAVVDDVLDGDWAEQLAYELQELRESETMQPNKVQFTTTAGPVVVTKPHIWEADLHGQGRDKQCPLFAQLWRSDSIVDALQGTESGPALRLVPGTDARTVKLQVNDGEGGCFPHHYDNPGPPNKRSLTCILYLNRDRGEGDGGEVELVPFLRKPTAVAPLFNRAVLFRSDRVLHRVLPNKKQRLCCTIWIDGSHTNSAEDVELKVKHLSDPELADKLRNSALQRSVSRAVYNEEYETSLRDCFGMTKSFAVMAAAHRQAVARLLSDPRAAECVESLVAQKEQ